MFYYDLAERLGYASVARLLREVTSEEISEWQAYFSIRQRQDHDREVQARAKQSARKR